MRKPTPAAAPAPDARDQDPALGITSSEPQPEMQQAAKDLKKGLVDTDARGKDGRPLGSKRPTK